MAANNGMRCLYRLILKEIMEIGKVHETFEGSVCNETTDSEQAVMDNIDRLIEKGVTGLYPLKALLMACNNWYSFEIVRESMFEGVLWEGINKGALAPDNEEGWAWLRFAAISNDPEKFMLDMTYYFDLVMTAVENGNQDAREIMDMIWEPENCQEED